MLSQRWIFPAPQIIVLTNLAKTEDLRRPLVRTRFRQPRFPNPFYISMGGLREFSFAPIWAGQKFALLLRSTEHFVPFRLQNHDRAWRVAKDRFRVTAIG